MIYGYDLLDIDGNHFRYCNDCYDDCSPWFQMRVFDTIEEPFKCEGCNTFIGDEDDIE